jgi:SAM-dependent methyltransferase
MLNILDIGGNDGIRSHLAYPNAAIMVVDKKRGWDITKMGLPSGHWDIILANHLIEHLDDVDTFLSECKKHMDKDTILEISTPNLCAWFNRILFLFGWLPHSYEVSYEYNVGKCFGWNKERIGGHLRVFSVKALVELLEKHGFKILDVRGEPSTYPCHAVIKTIDKVLSRWAPLASAFRVRCYG